VLFSSIVLVYLLHTVFGNTIKKILCGSHAPTDSNKLCMSSSPIQACNNYMAIYRVYWACAFQCRCTSN